MAKKNNIDLTRLFLPYQRKWIKDNSFLKLAEKSRQVGFSWTEAFISTSEAMSGKWNIYFATRDVDLGVQFIEDCRGWAKLIGAVCRELDLDPVDIEKDVIKKLTFSSGKTIYLVSSSTTAIIGRRGKIILDEFGDHKDQEKLFEAAEPCTTWGGQLVIFSAHYHGKKTFFNKLVKDRDNYGFSFHRITFTEAVMQGLLDRILEKVGRVEEGKFKLKRPKRKTTKAEREAYIEAKKKKVGTKAFDQAYECKPSDEEGQFITVALYETCERPGILVPFEKLGHLEGELHVGVDVGRFHDLTVIWVVQKIGLQYITRYVEDMEKTPTPKQNRRLNEFLELPNVRRCCIDRTGIGVGLTDYAIEKNGSFMVEGVHFTSTIREVLGHRVKDYLEEVSFLVPEKSIIRSDFTALEKETTTGGNIRLNVTENEENPASHCDYFWAAALALESATGKPLGKPQVTTLPKQTVNKVHNRPRRLQKLLSGFRRS